MSSVYHILCVSHDPAITLHEEFHSGDDGLQRAEAAVAAGFVSHPGCDLLIGRYSYPLIEVGCPGRLRNHVSYHPRNTKWIDAFWLKLLYIAQHADESSDARLLVEKEPMLGCWTPERVHRLRYELEMEIIE